MTPGGLDPVACAVFLVGAFALAGLVQAVWLSAPASRRVSWPLDGGRTIRGRRLLGDNKTARGFVVIVPAAAAAFALLATVLDPVASPSTGLWALSVPSYAALGFWCGLGFMLGELPNSFVKRQCDVAPGHPPRARTWARLSRLVDRLDSPAGMMLALWLVVPVPALTWLYVALVGPLLHGVFSLLVFRLGGKARAA